MNQIALSDFELTRFFLAVVLLLVSAHGFGYLGQRLLKLPKVIGEIAGGLVLGPTVLGHFYPSFSQAIFSAFPHEGQLIASVYWIGLVLLMFISGFEVQKTISREDKRLVAAILFGATAIPFLIGLYLPSIYDFSPYLGSSGNSLALTIVVGIAIAVTSIPVISRIFIDLEIIGTRFAKIVLATATLEDILLWVALAVATGLAGGESLSASGVITNVLITVGFFVATLLVMPWLFETINKSRANLLIKSSAVGYVLVVCFLFAAIASLLDVNIIFGAFLAGVVVGMSSSKKIEGVKVHIKEIGLGFFIPFYFAVVGLKLDLVQHFDWSFFFTFLILAVLIKTAGTIITAKLAKQDWRTSINLGVAMNARGGPGIVLATAALELGIINQVFFGVLVLTAVLTSAAAGYWFRYILSRGWQIN